MRSFLITVCVLFLPTFAIAHETEGKQTATVTINLDPALAVYRAKMETRFNRYRASLDMERQYQQRRAVRDAQRTAEVKLLQQRSLDMRRQRYLIFKEIENKYFEETGIGCGTGYRGCKLKPSPVSMLPYSADPSKKWPAKKKTKAKGNKR